MPHMDKKKLEDRRIWERMGRELAALDELIVKIRCDPEYLAVMDSKTWDWLDKLCYHLDLIRGYAESRMARFIPDRSTTTFFPYDREDIESVVQVFRNSMKEAPTHE